MKHLFIALCTCVFLSLKIQAQEQIKEDPVFRMSLELIKPNGKIDNSAYFLLTIYNKSNDEYRILPGCDGTIREQKNSFLQPQVMKVNSEIETGENSTCFYDADAPEDRLITPKSLFKQKIPLFSQQSNFAIIGLLPTKDLKNYTKARVKLDRFIVANLKTRKGYTATLYSNWVDISKEDFSKMKK